jgi:hypothetical protein
MDCMSNERMDRLTDSVFEDLSVAIDKWQDDQLHGECLGCVLRTTMTAAAKFYLRSVALVAADCGVDEREIVERLLDTHEEIASELRGE